MRIDPDHLRRFAARDWGAPERLSREARARAPVEDRIRLAVALYEAARAALPVWPDDAARLQDLAHHQRLRALLDRAPHVGVR